MSENIPQNDFDNAIKELELAVGALRAVYEVLKFPPAHTLPHKDSLLIYIRLLEQIQRKAQLLSQAWPQTNRFEQTNQNQP